MLLRKSSGVKMHINDIYQDGSCLSLIVVVSRHCRINVQWHKLVCLCYRINARLWFISCKSTCDTWDVYTDSTALTLHWVIDYIRVLKFTKQIIGNLLIFIQCFQTVFNLCLSELLQGATLIRHYILWTKTGLFWVVCNKCVKKKRQIS